MGVKHCMKELGSSLSGPLFKLKVCYFFSYSVWFATQPYLSVMPTQIITYRQLAILYACSPVVSIGGPILTGFIGDKLGNYKALVSFGVMVGASMPFGMLWLFIDHQNFLSAQQNMMTRNFTNYTETLRPGDIQQPYTFPLLVFFRLMCFYSSTSTLSLLDACAMTMCKKHGGDFGRQKLWGNASMAVIPLICGVLVDVMSSYLGYQFDTVAFCVGAVVAVVVIPLISQLDLEVERNKKSIINTVKEVSAMVDFNVFIFVSLVVGMAVGFHMIYRPVYLTELHGSKTLIGLLLSASGIGAMVILSIIRSIIEKLGEPNTVALTLLLFCSRSVVYYFLQNPYVIVVIELLDGFCGFSAIVAGSYYCAAEAPPGMLASLNGIVVAATFGAGRGIGTSVGSMMISEFGIRTTYLFFSYLTGGTALFYVVVYHLFLKKIRENRKLSRDKDRKEVNGIENHGVELGEKVEDTLNK